MSRTAVLIVAAGRGRRAGGPLPKQYVGLAGEMVLKRTLQAFDRHPRIAALHVVIHPDDEALYRQATAGVSHKLKDFIVGGASRQQSVQNGLNAMAAQQPAPDRVLIHDAARPFIDAALINRVIDGLDDHDCVLPVTPVTDTVKRVENGFVTDTLDRSSLFGAQTPQGFQFKAILELHRKASKASGASFTDDASIAEQFGLAVHTVAGAPENVKLTTPNDMAMGELMLRQGQNDEQTGKRETRTGTGLDVHRFEPGDGVMLCGVKVPHEFRLKGHSDADVAMHALTDAILGAIGEGDIGAHFPPGDPQWKDAPSSLFLQHAMRLAAKAGGRLVNADVTIICERPKIGEYRDEMRRSLAVLMQTDVSRISVKATTTEQLGFTGRREGVAASAVANIELRADDE